MSEEEVEEEESSQVCELNLREEGGKRRMEKGSEEGGNEVSVVSLVGVRTVRGRN